MKDDFFRPLLIGAIFFFIAAGAIFLWGVRTDMGLNDGAQTQSSSVKSAATGAAAVAEGLAKLAGVVALAAFVFLLYFFPSINAEQRHHRERKSIFILNLLLGWAVIGWVIALVWSYSSQVEKTESGQTP